MYTLHSDAGHGWLAVKKQELIDLDILDKISPYSYVSGDTFYLEEDYDAGLFINAMKAKGIEIKYTKKDHGNYSSIRGMERVSNKDYISLY